MHDCWQLKRELLRIKLLFLMKTISIQKSISLHKKIESEKTSSNLSTKKRFLHQQKSKVLAAVRNDKQMKEFWVKTSRSSASACFYPHSHPINLSFRRNPENSG